MIGYNMSKKTFVELEIRDLSINEILAYNILNSLSIFIATETININR